MTVEDLIEHFEAAPSIASTPAGSIQATTSTKSPTLPDSESSHLSSESPSLPASYQYHSRFLSHNDTRNSDNKEDTLEQPRHEGWHIQSHAEPSPGTDITDAIKWKHRAVDGLPLHSGLIEEPSGRYSHEYSEDKCHLLPRHDTSHEFTPSRASRHRYPHPVPATAVFARNAPPLHLPELDNFLSSLSPPAFSGASRAMFPPMNKLAESGKSLDDLETNATVAPAWRNRKSLLETFVNLVLGLTGSSALASYYSLQGLLNTVQVFALILSTIVPISGNDFGDEWRNLFLGTIPNILALNFASTLVESLIFLMIYLALAAGLLYIFHRSGHHGVVEGLQSTVSHGTRWRLILVTFLLTVIYLPLSTMAVHVLVWSQDLWVVPNPYTNATSYPPVIPPLGPSNEYRDPLDFCWTTTMRRNQVNYAPFVIILAALVFIFLTIWFPVALYRAIKFSVPKVDKFTELGRPRNNHEMDEEYHRLLDRDQNPFAFLYSGFRRSWGTYESTYLGAKISTLLIVAVIDSNNCLFRSVSRSALPIIRQVVLVLCALFFFLVQCIFTPFLDPINNASEWTSRLNYLTTSIVALIVALDIPSSQVFSTHVLYAIYVLTYSLSFYFTVINLGPIQRLLKRFTRRFDFSIDIFSPRLDVTSSSPHTKRRIWQESITALFLTTPDCAIPQEQTMTYALARDSEFPPYLLCFGGTPGERHVENLKILRDVGTLSYNKAVALTSDINRQWHSWIEQKIQRHFVGPDCYWKNPASPGIPGCKNYFGNAWWIPFPPTLVLQYDDGPLTVLTDFVALKTYISQNSSPDIRRRRLIRLSLRALEGRIVSWPYNCVLSIGANTGWLRRTKYEARKSIHFTSCILKIERRGHLLWGGLQLGSGLDVKLQYTKKILVSGEAIGLNDDYDLTPPLAQFLELNHSSIVEGLPYIEEAVDNYCRYHRKVNEWKNRVLTYRFLSDVYDHPHDPAILRKDILEFERDPRVRRLANNCEVELNPAYRRWILVSQSETRTWWYLFWDDLWRRNHDTIPGLERYASDFDPHYPTSIAYIPLPRAALETFLTQRGLFSKTGSWTRFFTPGFLNKIYLRLNGTVFQSSSREIKFHIGNGSSERDMIEVDLETRIGQPSSIGTGGGTDYDDSWIITRPQFRWEGILSDPLLPGKRKRHFFSKMSAWLGWTPTWRSGLPSDGLSIDVKLENGRFVLLHSDLSPANVADNILS